MNLTDIAHSRLINQQIAQPNFKTAKELVSWMGAMQAQDGTMVNWAIGLRLPESTSEQITAALNTGELIRTHLLRPTWHVVAAEDIYWLLDLTAPQIKALLKSRHKGLELNEAIFATCQTVIEDALAGGKQLTREELMTELGKAGIPTDNNRSAHIMLQAELDGIVANGAVRGKQATYALLAERVPKSKPLHREEALAKLARTYFTSHGPATLADFVWWSGLSVADARHGLALIKSELVSEQIESQTYWFANSFSLPQNENESIYVLPAFDELIISYKDRSAVLTMENHKQAVSENGIFRPTIVLNGTVIGTWKRTAKKDKTLVEAFLFQSPDNAVLSLLEKAFAPFGQFLNQKIDLTRRLL